MASIELHNVCLDFPVYGMVSRSFRKDLIRISTGGRWVTPASGKIVHVRALDKLNLKIEHGDRIGLIGHNGSGKSSLLRVLSRIYEPTQGNLRIEGKVYSLLDVMLGMDPESTGHENIILCGLIHGLTRKEIRKKQNEIAEFTELGDYLSMPIRTYSTGMQVRLAFSIATSVLPEILILDEVIGAGDASFIEKARNRLFEIMNVSEIVLLASHDLNILETACKKILWLDAGQVKLFGETKFVLDAYRSLNINTIPNEVNDDSV
ncbi:MAG: ABC transporter ATP-binding protein [Gammaproteobacteria bacterium]|nr:ABC transporter ATP-binding protein [Gammaproteobacteria bacterium]